MSGIIKRRFGILKKLRWFARITSLLFIIAWIVFFVGDGFDISNITSGEWVSLFYFPLGVAAGLIIGWKYDLIGGLISLLCLWYFFYFYSFKISEQIPSVAAFLIFSVPAVLFLISGIYAYFAIGKLAVKESEN